MLWDLRKRRPTHFGGSHGNMGPRNLCVSPPLSRKAGSVSRVLSLYCIYCIYFLKINKKFIKKERRKFPFNIIVFYIILKYRPPRTQNFFKYRNILSGFRDIKYIPQIFEKMSFLKSSNSKTL